MDKMERKTSEEKFLLFLDTIHWLDKKRWEEPREWGLKEACEDLDEKKKYNQIILTHWLTYIHNRVKSAETLWEDTAPVMKNLVDDYYNKVESEDDVNKIHSKYEDKIGGMHCDRESVIRTLKILLEYDKSLVKFLLGTFRNGVRII